LIENLPVLLAEEEKAAAVDENHLDERYFAFAFRKKNPF